MFNFHWKVKRSVFVFMEGFLDNRWMVDYMMVGLIIFIRCVC